MPASSLGAIQEGFGRFGYGKYPSLPGFTFSAEGFKPSHAGADQIKFASPLRTFNPVAVDRIRMVAMTDGGPGRPSKVRFDLADFGFSMYFPAGIELKVSATSSPLLTWKGGSVKEGYPTPDSDWVGLSYQDRQPPLVFGFPGDKANLSVKGELGNWTIRSNPDFKGWVRVCLPYGTEAFQTTTASQLGQLSARLFERELLWYAPMNDLAEPKIEEDPLGLTAIWSLPRQRTVIPLSLFYGQFGAYPVKIQSPYTIYPSRLNGDPIVLSSGGELKVRFPVRRVPNGRGLSVGELLPFDVSQSDWKNPLSLISLALTNTLANRGRDVGKLVKQVQADYYEAATPTTEPNSRLSVMYGPSGQGLVEAAVHSLLTQSGNMGLVENQGEDPQFQSIAWRYDIYSGSLGVPAEDQRRVLAIASIAGAFSANPEHRLSAALMEAGLSAEAGKEIWLRRQGVIKPSQNFLEPLIEIRKGIFALTTPVKPDPIISNWFSEIRAFSETPLWVNRVGEGYELCWDARRGEIESMRLIAPYTLAASSRRNIASMFNSHSFGSLDLRTEAIQSLTSAATLQIPSFAETLPLTALPPQYKEPKL